jgi:hypothetical protein
MNYIPAAEATGKIGRRRGRQQGRKNYLGVQKVHDFDVKIWLPARIIDVQKSGTLFADTAGLEWFQKGPTLAIAKYAMLSGASLETSEAENPVRSIERKLQWTRRQHTIQSRIFYRARKM